MPFYEYQCKSCGHELEAMQKVSDPPLKKCPHCGKSQLQRLMSAPIFRLKGGGWYETDFKGDKDNQRNLADRAEDAPKDTKDAKDTDSKESDSKAKDEKGKDDKGKDDKGKEDKRKDDKGRDEKGKDGKDAKTTETKASETASSKDSTAAKDKSAGKPPDKSSGSGGSQKPTAANRSSRGGRLKKKSIKVKRRR
jgi:putative FmdB family regulatory protein